MKGTMGGAIVVLDAAGVVGRGLVAAALDAGHAVIAIAADPDAIHPGARGVAAGAPKRAPLLRLRGSTADEAGARALADALRALGRPIAAVLSTIDAGRLRGRLIDQPADATCAALSASLAPQLAVTRHLLPVLADNAHGGSFVLVGGPGGKHPWAGYGQRSLTEAALRMLARILHDEARALGVRLQLLSVDTPTCGLHAGPPRAHWPSALEIGQHAVRLVAGGTRGDAIVEFARTAPPVTARVAHAQAADSAPPPRATACLQDARALLGRLATPNALKETFPQ